ncbi:hypothetical protein [Bartonella elizabethae]|uniref:hypothetical protein n=1 Tax=Bartonella elizabethae TaxID=807 RepID=UPI000315F114|nr:hypothetical protein [Bartonella elizabethae]
MGLDVDLQAVEKTWALLEKQHHKTQNFPEKWIGEIDQFFYKTLCRTIIITQLALCLLILLEEYTRSLRCIHKG